MFKTFSLAMAALLLSAAAANAGKITNLDDVERTVTITEIGNVSQNITLKPGESYRYYGPYFELSTAGQPYIPANGLDEYVVRKGKIQIMMIRDDGRMSR